jgi:PncC family amidohydrolase
MQEPATGHDSLANLAQEAGALLRRRGLTLAVAESCTGGGLGDAVTDIAGSSDYFLGGVIAYSNGVKEALLGVPHGLLEAQGAVSGEVAGAMAEGARRLLGADVALSITGIAGPTGGTPEKPVGLVYISLATAQGTTWRRFVWGASRRENKLASVQAALQMLVAHLERCD